MAGLRFHVAAWAGWLPGYDALSSGGALAPARALPTVLRRRVTGIGRKALEAVWAVLPAEGEPRIVLSSRHGEYSRTFALLSGLAETGEVSPAEFSLSVHHALAGLLSIASGNHAGHSAVAAGPESFGHGMLEAAACLAEDRRPVVLVHFDEALPDIYAETGCGLEAPVALALRLELGESMVMEMLARDGGETAPLALAFARLLTEEVDDVRATGDRLTWRWRRAV